MSKKSILYILIDLIFIAIFNTVFFILNGTDNTVSVWISYGFIHFSWLMLIITSFLTPKDADNAIFKFTLYSVSSIYFLTEFIIGLIIIFMKSESYKTSLIIQILLVGVYAIILITNITANEDTYEKTKQQENESTYIKQISSKIKILTEKSTDKNANKKIEELYDLIHSSPSKSSPTVRYEENEIIDKVNDLENAVTNNSASNIITISEEISYLIKERNRKLKL